MDDIKIRYPALNSPVVFIAGSAGSIEEFKKIASTLPEDFNAPVFFILHRLANTPHKQNQLLEIIKKVSNLKVVEVEEGETVRSNRIYLAPLNKNILFKDNVMTLSDLDTNSKWRPSLDVIIKSGAREFQDKTVSVLLTGMLEDGVEGLLETTHFGGITIVQCPSDASYADLPISGIIKDHPSFVLPVDDLAPVLCELSASKKFNNQKEITIKAARTAYELKAKMKPEETL